MNHGPGTDRGGKDPESDTNFGRIINGGESIVTIMQTQPGHEDSPNGFIKGPENFINIKDIKLVEPDSESLLRNMLANPPDCVYELD